MWLWGAGRTGSDVLSSGVFAGLKKVPTTAGEWATAPYEAQFLKLYDVTPPPLGGAPGTPKAYALGSTDTFSWSAASDPVGGIAGYHVIISTQPNGGGTTLFDGTVTGTSKTITGTLGQTFYATVRSINNAGIESTSSINSAFGTTLLDPLGDIDGDGMNSGSEDVAGTNPLSNSSVLRVTNSSRPTSTSFYVTWSSVPGKTYRVQASTTLESNSFTDISGDIPASAGATTSYSDLGANGLWKFYRVRVVTQ